eukprot:06709.XXX_25130_25234_1 [CDS] Oithona nana genome sequencing.
MLFSDKYCQIGSFFPDLVHLLKLHFLDKNNSVYH